MTLTLMMDRAATESPATDFTLQFSIYLGGGFAVKQAPRLILSFLGMTVWPHPK